MQRSLLNQSGEKQQFPRSKLFSKTPLQTPMIDGMDFQGAMGSKRIKIMQLSQLTIPES